MDRPGGYAQSLPHSFSLPSLVEGSEPISEAEEFIEMKSLREHGDKALKVDNYAEAIRCYNEALEIDDRNADVLLARAVACIQMGDFISAQRDTELLIGMDPEDHKAYRLQGIALKQLNQNKESLASFLLSLELDPGNADELTDFIAEVAGTFCTIPAETLESVRDMDAYKKLSEVGVCLFQAKKYKICIRILEAAQKFQTNQKGITMRVLLTLANAHSALKRTDQAISLYQDCLATAIATHDQVYQTKALVNIATLYLENQDTHQAIIYYEKLLHLEAELLDETGSEDALPDFWTKELQCGLHLNLSIAYKAIADMNSAIKHAKQYVLYIEKYNFQGKLKAESYHNTGMLNEILGNYREAIGNYNKYLEECKRNGDKKGMAQAYGCLGSVYASLRNWKLSITYHEHYITMATRFGDKRMLTIAYEMLGDTLMLKDDYEGAVQAYEMVLNTCIRIDYRVKAMGLCKMGNAYRAAKKRQYSAQFYQQASDLAEDYGIPEIETLSQYSLACMQQNSSQITELEQALKFFTRLIPFFESKIREHQDEDSHCPAEYHSQLLECYDGIQTVLAKLGNKEECLQYAEAYRKRHLTQTQNYQASAFTSQSHTAPWDMWTVERLSRIVSQQNSTVLYYSVLKCNLLLWVLKPGEGLVRFYCRRAAEDQDIVQLLEATLGELRQDCDWKQLQLECESRALPLKDSELERIRMKYLKLQAKTPADQAADTSSVPQPPKSTGKPEKTAQRRLYDLLFAPIEDILTKLGKESPLIIVPDKVLHHCPFGILQDFLHRYAFERFNITYLPHLLLLDKVVANEQNRLRIQDELNFARAQSKKGGMVQLLSRFGNGSPRSISGTTLQSAEDVNPKRVSNPRLLSRGMSRGSTHVSMPTPQPGHLPRQNTMFEEDFRQRSPWKLHSPGPLPGIPESRSMSPTPRGQAVATPTPLQKMMNFHTYSTLTTETSTGTDITSSNSMLTSFKQISCKDRCLVFGNPKLPESLMLHGRCWKPGVEELEAGKREAHAVASYLDVEPITGLDATKEKFFREIEQAVVIHIVTYGCWEEGLLVLAPNPSENEDQPPEEMSYLVSANDILGLKLTALLVVINTGYTPFRRHALPPGYLLPSAFLAAGAQCVMAHSWPLPDPAVEKYFFHFYTTLQRGALVTVAAREALKQVRADNRYSSPVYWSGFLLIGKDVEINLAEVRHAMLDQNIDRTETQVEQERGVEYLNPKPVIKTLPKKEDNLCELQSILSVILQRHKLQPLVVVELIDLLDSALKRLHTEENNRKTTTLSKNVTKSQGGLDLLKLLGFHFQAHGATLANPYVVYPHWNNDELLVPTFDSLRAIQELAQSSTIVQALCDCLPLTQDHINLLVDLMSVTKHAPEVQLKVSDLSVRPVWVSRKLKTLLTATGFHQIGMLLNFNRTPQNRALMSGLFQFLLAVSQYKSQVLLYRLDVNLLGKNTDVSSASAYPEMSKLPSLTPLILPRHQLRMSTPWLSAPEKSDEMEEKLRLAKSKSDLDDVFKERLERAKTWHQMTVEAQANESLAKFGRPKSNPAKVKVIGGSSGSRNRIPVAREPVLVIPEVDQRRDYAHYVLHQRVQNISTHHKNEVMKLYMPYVNSV